MWIENSAEWVTFMHQNPIGLIPYMRVGIQIYKSDSGALLRWSNCSQLSSPMLIGQTVWGEQSSGVRISVRSGAGV